MILNTSPDAVTGTLKALAERNETCHVLEKIRVPVLIICGKDDKVTPPEKSEYLKANINGSKLFVINEAAHISNMEQPEIFNSHLEQFIKAISNFATL
jgi:pimeloyl-ACP methyl ester carboxylesterase